MSALDFEHGFNAFVDAHQKKWKHDRSQSVGASEAFGCLRKTFFGKNNYPKDADYKNGWGALQRGDLIENHFVEPAMVWFLENLCGDARLIWGGKKQRTLIDGRLSATPDGLVVNADDDALVNYGVASLGGSGCFTFEIKSIDPRVNLKEEKAVHRGQVQVQMGLTRKLTKYKPNYAVIIYIDASFFDDIDIFIVPFDQKTFDIANVRANSVYTIKNPAEIMPEGKYEGGCEYCPFQTVCAVTNRVNTPDSGEANVSSAGLALLEEFEAIVRRERDANAAKKALEADHKQASEELKQWFRDVGMRKAVSSDESIKASISWIKGRKSYDVEAMRADGIDVEKYAKMSEGHDRLSISEKGATRADAD